MDGSYGPAAEKVQEFVGWLRDALPIPIQTWDERLTSVQAQRMLREASVKGAKQRKKVDQMAAAILLQSYLDAQPELPTG
jgi:putative Holliday junction resolvase